MSVQPPADFLEVACPWCGELQEIGIELDLRGEFYLDCQVCCRPWKVNLDRDGWGDPQIRIEPADG